MQIKKLLIAVGFFLGLLSFANCTHMPKLPFAVPFAAHKAGSKIETDFRIVEHRSYIFQLRLGFREDDAKDRERVSKLAGGYSRDKSGKLVDAGVSVPLRLKISSFVMSEEKPLFEKEILEQENTGFSAHHYYKEITQVVLRPGHYRVVLESLRDVPAFEGTPVDFGITTHPKTTPIPD